MKCVAAGCGLLMSLLYFGVAHGAQMPPTPPSPVVYTTPPVEWVLKQGEPVRFQVVDGREITLMRTPLHPDWVKIPFTIHENVCKSQSIGQQGAHALQVLAVKAAAVWSKHPDPTKIGQVVKVKNPMDGTSLAAEISDFLPPSSFRRMPELRNLMQQEELQMQDFSWIPEHTPTTAPENLHIVRWEGELMLTNPETGVDENRPFQGYNGIDLEKKSDTSLRLTRIRDYPSAFGIYVYPFGDVTTFNILNSKKELCQIAMKIDQGSFAKEVTRLRALSPKLDQPFIYGHDSLLALWIEQRSFVVNQITAENFYTSQQDSSSSGVQTSYRLKEME